MAFETHAVDFGVQMVVRECIDPPRRQGTEQVTMPPCHGRPLGVTHFV